MIEGREQIDELLGALNAALVTSNSSSYELLICGGAALAALELIVRPTLDVDILALVEDEKDVLANPLPEELFEAVTRVAQAQALDANWLNPGPAEIQKSGLPSGILKRSTRVIYGEKLSVRFISRTDQIFFKLYALVDQGTGKHLDDFLVLNPTESEVLEAAKWCVSQDPSEGFSMVLTQALAQLGYRDAAEQFN